MPPRPRYPLKRAKAGEALGWLQMVMAIDQPRSARQRSKCPLERGVIAGVRD